MITNTPGKLADNLYLLGDQTCLMYLLKGRDSMFLGGGMSWIVPRLEQQLQEFGLDREQVKYLVIPHPHFDHCGAVPYLKRKYPHLNVLASDAAKAILAKPKVIAYIELVNLLMVEHFGLKDQYEKLGLKIDAINVETAVNDSTVIDLGNGIKVSFTEVPGHSPGDVAAYVPALKALFPSDAVPCTLGSVDKLARPSPQFDFGRFKESLKKLAAFDTDILGFDHYGAVTGSDARQVMLNDIRMTDEYGKRIVSIYSQMKDFEQVARLVARETLEVDNFDFLNEDLMMPVARAEVRNILKDSGITVV